MICDAFESNKSQINNLRYTTARSSPLTAHFLPACCLLPSANCFLSDPTNSVTDARSIAFTFTYAATESASVGCGDFVSWIAV
jgi:hypothetical protein